MKQPIQAGGQIETLTPGEFREELPRALRNWFAEVVRGVRFRPLYGTAPAGATLTIEINGPDEGFMWSVTRLAVDGLGAATEFVSVYRNEVSPSTLIHPELRTVEFITSPSLVLQPGEKLIIVGSALAAGPYVVTAAVKEVPVSMAWLL